MHTCTQTHITKQTGLQLPGIHFSWSPIFPTLYWCTFRFLNIYPLINDEWNVFFTCRFVYMSIIKGWISWSGIAKSKEQVHFEFKNIAKLSTRRRRPHFMLLSTCREWMLSSRSRQGISPWMPTMAHSVEASILGSWEQKALPSHTPLFADRRGIMWKTQKL